MTAASKLFDFIPERYFVKSLRENRIGHIKLAFVRETINPLIIRSTEPESTIYISAIDGRDLVEIPPRKLKSREKLLGLMICREFGVADGEVHYNSIMKSEHLSNPNSLLFGDSVTQSQDATALPSRAVYDWAYSLRDVKDITDKLQHNAMSEDGTILKDKDFNPAQTDGTKVAKQALHQTEYVLPGTLFPHFITVDNITPELLVHLLSCVLNQRRYGAQTTTNANNINNHLVAVGFTDFEKPINSYTISKAWNSSKNASESKNDAPTLESVTMFVQEQMKAHYGKNLLDSSAEKDVSGLVNWVNDLWTQYEFAREDEERKKANPLFQIYETAKSSVDAYLKEIKMVSEPSSTGRPRGRGKRGEKNKPEESQPSDPSLFPAMEKSNENPPDQD